VGGYHHKQLDNAVRRARQLTVGRHHYKQLDNAVRKARRLTVGGYHYKQLNNAVRRAAQHLHLQGCTRTFTPRDHAYDLCVNSVWDKSVEYFISQQGRALTSGQLCLPTDIAFVPQ
jgi:hypothetical protein